MIQLLKKTSYLVIISIFVICLLSYLYSQTVSLLSFINFTFFISSFFILLYLLLFVAKGGFFDGITYSFRRFTKQFSRTEVFAEDDLEQMALPSEMLRYKKTTPIILNGLILFVLMLVGLLFYYL
ncbi:DUF3899 domain-containing protein [Bacillus luteolus]|uniref:DUF3899 domain-containing protein n=1 Tax=Litchfieldia luteola TaxID=682179 RepID=A0ABR9QLJ9_9BACI|nr:DUF3899 domain-containing protein [Cytobacillus luteolus]MBE4909375.1 DUF3899 domain-containing protein [Cytobacillus luteolus]MBP1940773.1 hypothetical protein [Cytobacillus luteolus]